MTGPQSHPPALLERVAAIVLLLLNLALGWIVFVSWQPKWLRLPSIQLEVLLILGVLTGALLLVSIVALRQTRA